MRKKHISQETAFKISSARRLLGLDPGQNEFNVTCGSASNRSEIAVLSRSVLEIIVEMASYIDVPESHVADGRVHESLIDQMEVGKEFSPLREVNSDEYKPQIAFVKVRKKEILQ